MIQRVFDIDPWKIKTEKLDTKSILLMESLTSIGNGYMGMRSKATIFSCGIAYILQL